MRNLANLIAVTSLVALAPSANAYIGPGLGAGTIGVALGVIGSIFLAIFAVVFYPLKRALKKRRKARAQAEVVEAAPKEPLAEADGSNAEKRPC